MSESNQPNQEQDKRGQRKQRVELPEPQQQAFALDEGDLLSNSPGLFSQAAIGSDLMSHGPSSLLSRAPSSLLQRQVSALAGREDKLQGGYPQLRLRGRNFAQLAGQAAGRPPVQAKLMVGPAADAYAQEADRVAEQVASVPAPPATLAQRAGEEDNLQAKPLAATLTPLVQRELAAEELQAKFVQRADQQEEALQTKPLVQRAGGGFEAGAEFEHRLGAARGGGAPLPDHTRDFMEQRLGADFSGVRVHTDAQADQLNQAIQAKAFTTGQEVFFRQGAYQPGSRGGQALIAHELTHVVQQNGGAVSSSLQPQEQLQQLPATESPSALSSDRVIQLMSFKRFSGFLGSFKSYNDKEQKLLNLEKRTGEALDGLKGYHTDEQYGERLQNLQEQFTDLTDGTYEESQYEATLKSLNAVFYAADSISTKIAAQDFQDEKELNELIAGSFEVVESAAKAERPNQITPDKLIEITTLLNDIYFANESNLVIAPDMSYGTYDLAKRSAELEQSVPPEVVILELKIGKMESQRETIQADINITLEERNRLQISIRQKSRDIELLDKEQAALEIQEANRVLEQEQAALEIAKTRFSQAKSRMEKLDNDLKEPKKEYDILVKRVIKKETMKDLVKIAQTGVGRDLLKAIAKTSLETNAKKVTINAYSQYKNPTAAESKGTKNPYVDYTPQYFKNRDTQERQEGGAIRKFERLKAHNPWQENERTDITLFHELVHTHHFQSGASEKNDLVSVEDSVHTVDNPYGSGEDRRGVREEEYATVGLGKYSGDKFTENAYRAERRSLGEEVSARDMYTHKDEEGSRAI